MWGETDQAPTLKTGFCFCFAMHCTLPLLNADEPGALPEWGLLVEFGHDGAGLEKL
jgi:hypothetical protein